MDDPYNLQRFVEAQEPIFEAVLEELTSGLKVRHWMWFVFPQIKGLGFSSMARRYEIASLEEAEAYLEHPILGSRLRESTRLVNELEGRTIRQIFGQPDDRKFRSSMTLFAKVAQADQIFQTALGKYCEGKQDPLTLGILGQ